MLDGPSVGSAERERSNFGEWATRHPTRLALGPKRLEACDETLPPICLGREPEALRELRQERL